MEQITRWKKFTIGIVIFTINASENTITKCECRIVTSYHGNWQPFFY